MAIIKQMVGLGRPANLESVNTHHGNAVYQGGGTVRMKRRPIKSLAVFASLVIAVAACGSSTKSSTATTTASNATTPAAATTAAAATTVPATSAGAATTAGGAATTPATTAAGTTAPATTASGANTTPDVPKAPASLHKGGTLKLAIDGEAACYVPSLCTVSYGPGAVRFAVLDNLVIPAPNNDGYSLSLASSVTPNADFTVFTIKLRSGVKWSDGTPLVAGDIKKLFDTYVLAPKSSLKGNVAQIKTTDAPDDSTVVFTLSAPTAPFAAQLTLIPIWKPTDGQTNTSMPVGTGPFMFQSFQPNVKTVVVRNPNYYGKDSAGNQLPYLDEIDVTAIASGDTRANSLQSGGNDLAMSIDPLEIQTLAKVATVDKIDLNAGGGVFINTAKAPTDDVRVRQALAYATNKTDILQAIGGGDARDEYWVKSSPWYSADASKATPAFDATKAKDLLNQYINDPNRSDKQPVGTPLALNFAHVQGAITQESIAALVQQQWSAIGIKVTVTPFDQSTLIGDAIAGNYNTTYFGWATPTPFSLLQHNYGPSAKTPTNFTHFDNADLQTIIGQMATAGTTDAMNTLVAKSDLIFAQQLPVIFLHSTSIGWAATKTVGNISLRPGDGFVDMRTLSLAG